MIYYQGTKVDLMTTILMNGVMPELFGRRYIQNDFQIFENEYVHTKITWLYIASRASKGKKEQWMPMYVKLDASKEHIPL